MASNPMQRQARNSFLLGMVITMVIAAVACTPVVKLVPENKAMRTVGRVCSFVLYLLCIMEIAAGSYNPFIYFRF